MKKLIGILLLLVMASTAQGQMRKRVYVVRRSATRVSSAAPVITGTLSMCRNGGMTRLTADVPGGEWSCRSPSLVAVDATNGICTSQGSGTGTAEIWYTLNGVVTIATVTVTATNATAGALSGSRGAPACCVGAFTTVTATNTGNIGVWSSNNAGIATVSGSTISQTTMSGVAQGTVYITALGNNGCSYIIEGFVNCP